MKFCEQHWNELREAIKDKGMWHLVHKSGEEAAAVMVKELKGESDVLDYDPLLASYFQLMGRALELGGLYLMGVDGEGKEFCPLCELNRNAPKDTVLPGEIPSTTWIQGCTNAHRTYCEEQGLVAIKA